jgi:hypothetical protein
MFKIIDLFYYTIMINTQMKFIHQLDNVDFLRSKQHFIVKIDCQLKCYVVFN